MANTWFTRLRRRAANTRKIRSAAGVGLRAERLEERSVPAIFTVSWNGVGPQPLGTLSLQQAIANANLTPGPDQIVYNVGTTSSLITSGSPLPDITDTVTIDGTPGGSGGATANVLCKSAANTDPVQGFVVNAGGVTIRDLIISDPAGKVNFNLVQSEVGVRVISALGGFNLQNVIVQGMDGDAVQIINSPNNVIGGTALNQKNTFIQDNGNGVLISGALSTNNRISGNWIGTNSTGPNLGLGGNGVLIDGSSNNIVGGTTHDAVNKLEDGNVIAFNFFNGIAVVETSGGPGSANGNQLLGNSIYSNSLLGIELNGTAGSVSANDSQDPDGGANRTQNYPNLVLATSTAAAGTNIQGTINSTPLRTFRIEFFNIDVANVSGTPPSFGQGKTFIGFQNVTTNVIGDAPFTFTAPSIVLPALQFISATATDLTTLDTSEFSLAQVIQGAPGPVTYTVNNDGNYYLTGPTGSGSLPVPVPPSGNPIILIPPNGSMTLALAIRLANEHPGDDRIVFALPPEYTVPPGSPPVYYQESRWIHTNGDVPDITDTLIIDGSPLAWPQVKGGAKNFDLNYTAIMNKGTHGLSITDTPTAQAKISNPTGTPDLSVFRHFNIDGAGASGIGVKTVTKFGGANLQDMTISGFGSDGVQISQSPNNIVGGSGANQAVNINSIGGTGVNIIGAASTNTLVQQTNIGFPIGPNGTGGAGGNGIWVQGAPNTTIGGFVAGTGVDIQGSGANGVYLLNSPNTRIQRSIIGDPITNLFPNHSDGVRVENSANTLIGGLNAGAGNNISGNTENGINIVGVNSASVRIQSNQIGTTTAPNSGDGIFINNVPNALIGSTTTAANNVDGNNLYGIEIRGVNASGARIVNTSLNANLLDGVLISDTTDVIVGGASTNAGGTNQKNRIGFSIINSRQVTVQAYNALGNSEEGFRIDSSFNLLIGGTGSTNVGNVASGNRDGIRVLNSNTVALQGNFVGTNRGGTAVLGIGQSEDGIIVDNSSTVSVGSPFQFGDNVISGNRNGVRVINGSAGFTIQHNEIGSNRTGTVVFGNTDDGIQLDAIFGATVGGGQSLSQNIVSGNRNGLHLLNGSGSATILGNVFSKSSENGILLQGSSDNVIGGKGVLDRNIMSSNNLNGIFLQPDLGNPFGPVFSNNNTITGNFIGTGFDGLSNFGNGFAGVYIDGGNDNQIGGTLHDAKNKFEEGNVIAWSGANGPGLNTAGGVVVVTDHGPAERNAIRGNNIFGNTGLGIDLNGNIGKVDDNDLLDVDGGANLTQNFPEIITAESGLIGSSISYKLEAAPSTKYHIEFFGTDVANPGGLPNGFGQGKLFVGSVDVTTDGTGEFLSTTNFFTLSSIPTGWFVSGTATDLAGNTSEFGKAIQVTDAIGSISGVKFNDLNGNGVQDLGEPGLAGWEIDLDFNNDNLPLALPDAKAITNGSGQYSFSRLIDGLYGLAEVQQTGWIQTKGPVPNPLQVTGGSAVTGVDFGNFKLLTIRGNKFEDVNGNGKKDSGEGPVAGVIIDLYGYDSKTSAKIKLGETTTDLSGNYTFTKVGPGGPGGLTAPPSGLYSRWEVYEKVPVGYVQTAPTTGFYTIPVVISGTDINNLDFGNKKTGGGGTGSGGGPQIIAGSGVGSSPLAVAFDAKGVQMFSIVPYATTFKGGVHVAKGDVNGDGINDIIVAPGSGLGPLVKVYDGTNGKLIKQFNAYDANWKGGVWVGAGDVNHDGTLDIITGASAGGASQVKVFDGQTGITLFDFNAYAATFKGGVRVAGGDVNGDGFADIIVAPGAGTAPTVKVFDGSTFGTGTANMIRQFNAYEASFTKGVYVAAGDFNGDAFADIVTGPESGRLPGVRVFDGATGVMTKEIIANSTGTPPPPGQISTDPLNTAGVRVACVDIDGDGVSDIVTGPGVIKSPRIRVFSGATSKVILNFQALPLNFLGGVFVG